MKLFEKESAEHQAFFIQKESFSCWRSSVVLMRNLFGVHQAAATHLLPISQLQIGLNFVGATMSKSEVHCILANLIGSGYIRGYISVTKDTLVVSKSNAFPPLRTIAERKA